MRELTPEELSVLPIVKNAMIQTHGEIEGLHKYEQYLKDVYKNIENEMNENVQPKKQKPSNICTSCGKKATWQAVQYCMDNHFKLNCYKCQQKYGMNRYSTSEPTAH